MNRRARGQPLQRENAALKKQLGAGPSPDMQKQMMQQTDQLAALQKENEFLKTQMTALKSASAITGKGNMVEELSDCQSAGHGIDGDEHCAAHRAHSAGAKSSRTSKNVVPRSEVREIEQERNDLRKRLAALAKDFRGVAGRT